MITMQLLNEMKECTRCHLRSKCNQVVPGTGNLKAKLIIIGDAPGYDEDIEGEPFVGRSGQLLTKLLNDAEISREEAYITNVIKCRPPENAAPGPIEIGACKTWLWQELKNLNPRVVMPVGKTATGLLLKKKTFAMGSVIGKMYKVPYINAIVMPWYHPGYLVERGAAMHKRTVDWFKKVKEKTYEIVEPKRVVKTS